jgi:hypothetical protein
MVQGLALMAMGFDVNWRGWIFAGHELSCPWARHGLERPSAYHVLGFPWAGHGL